MVGKLPKNNKNPEILTKKEQGFVKDVANGKSGTQAVKDNFNITDTNSAKSYAHKLKKKPKVYKRLTSIADSIPDSLLVKRHLQLLNKQEIVTKNNMSTGEVDVIKTGEIDAIAVKAGLDMAYKLKSSYAPIKITTTQVNEDKRSRLNKQLEYLHEKRNKIRASSGK